MTSNDIESIRLDFKEGIDNGEICGPAELIHYLLMCYDYETTQQVFHYYKEYKKFYL